MEMAQEVHKSATITALRNWPVAGCAFHDEVEAGAKRYFNQIGSVPRCHEREMTREEYMRLFPHAVVRFAFEPDPNQLE